MRFRRLSFLCGGPLTIVFAGCGVPATNTGGSSGGTQGAMMGMGGGAGTAAGVGGIAGASGAAGSAAGPGGSNAGGASGAGGDGAGGSAGSGATAGSAGTAAGGGTGAQGGTAGASGSAGTTAADPCQTAVVCDDFEGDVDPAWAVQPQSDPAPEIDTAKAANGSGSSLKTVGTSQQSFITLEVPAQSFYVRAYMNFEQSTETINGHGWYIVAADSVSQGGGAQMRFGSSGNHGHKEIDFNVYNGGCTGEKTQFSDGASDGLAGWENTPYEIVQLQADQWYCVEGHFNGTEQEFRLWIDGAEVPGLHVTEETMCAGWAPTYTHVKLGAGANSEIGAIWYDDVAVSTTRIGCN